MMGGFLQPPAAAHMGRLMVHVGIPARQLKTVQTQPFIHHIYAILSPIHTNYKDTFIKCSITLIKMLKTPYTIYQMNKTHRLIVEK